MIYPFLVNFCFAILVGDSDNWILFLIKNGMVPFTVILLSTSKIRLRAGEALPAPTQAGAVA